MRTLQLAAFGLFGLIFAAGCSAQTDEGDEAEDGNSAVTTPRDKESNSLQQQQDARTAELKKALQNAKAEDFGSAIPANIKPSMEKLKELWSRGDMDVDPHAYTFITGANKAYIIETRKGGKGSETRQLYLYDAVGYPKTESKPVAIGKCVAPSLKPEAVLTCTSASTGFFMFEP